MRGWLIMFGGLGATGAAYSYVVTPAVAAPVVSLSGLCFLLLLVGLATLAVRGRAQ
jgi:hypothetical protein